MEIKGQLMQKLSEREGDSAQGHWKVAEYLIQPDGNPQWVKPIMMEVFDGQTNKVAKFDDYIGQQVTIQFDIEAREYNGRWYNKVRAWGIAPQVAQGIIHTSQPAPNTPEGLIAQVRKEVDAKAEAAQPVDWDNMQK